MAFDAAAQHGMHGIAVAGGDILSGGCVKDARLDRAKYATTTENVSTGYDCKVVSK